MKYLMSGTEELYLCDDTEAKEGRTQSYTTMDVHFPTLDLYLGAEKSEARTKELAASMRTAGELRKIDRINANHFLVRLYGNSEIASACTVGELAMWWTDEKPRYTLKDGKIVKEK
jgi:hypothetical protein